MRPDARGTPDPPALQPPGLRMTASAPPHRPDIPAPPPAWADLAFFGDDWADVQARLAADPRPWLPEPQRVFAALAIPPEQVRVVILGQDPYPNPAHAMGLAFSVPAGTSPLPRSLRNIFKELHEDLGILRASGDLSGWARQGVLLLNPVLTVPVGASDGHKRIGWQALTHQILDRVLQRPTALVLWGRQAQEFAAPFQDGSRHLVLASAHPSPLSARRGFFGSRPFSAVNRWLAGQGASEIDWSA